MEKEKGQRVLENLEAGEKLILENWRIEVSYAEDLFKKYPEKDRKESPNWIEENKNRVWLKIYSNHQVQDKTLGGFMGFDNSEGARERYKLNPMKEAIKFLSTDYIFA